VNVSIEQSVRDFIVRELLYEEEAATLDDDESLFARRAIDSIGLLRIVSFLEETYAVQIIDEELIPENMETIRSIATLVRSKQGAAGTR
jgi:acyl carrier protein